MSDSTKPLAEYLKSKFGLGLDQVVGLFKRGLTVRVNGVNVKNKSYQIREGDILEIANKSFKVEWTKKEERSES